MINVITLISYTGERIVMTLRRPELSGFLVMSPEGLGPVDSSINTSASPSGDSHYFTSSSTGPRTVKLPIVFWEDNTAGDSIETLRHKLEKMFRTRGEVGIVVESGVYGSTPERVGMLKGYIESNEVSFFTNQVGTTISIKCPDPWYRKVAYRADHEYVMSDYDTLFETSIGTGRHADSPALVSLNYDGDIRSGFVVDILVVGDVVANPYAGPIKIQSYAHRLSDVLLGELRLEAHRGDMRILPGQTITISTIDHKKAITRVDGANLICYYAGSSENWPYLEYTPVDVSREYNSTVAVYSGNDSLNIGSIKVKYPVLYGGM